ncbi:MAG: hypothetical protein Q3M24_09475 [Candidatus Electrothrix aestuarii]|uniref:Tetratricopeptide repeat-containing protein n=1 Tax=Candidatus Electrothrix aestuarii TaxID=3062594 RepID=A0AAU8M0C1_9BACT|nr:hypothetical protein [Candidatus Electrothrix aestuarii]
MAVSTGFLIYTTLYRLSILAVGALTIWLGFRLFNKTESKAYDDTGSVSAEGKGFKLALTSILPGTYFALFGTVIISTMLWKGEPPQLSEKQVVEQPGKATVSSERLMRKPDCRVNLDGMSDEWETLGRPGLPLTEAAGPLHRIACSYWHKNRIGEAVSMAKLAALYGKEEDKTEHLALLAELLRANGDEEEAAKTERAIEALRRRGQ